MNNEELAEKRLEICRNCVLSTILDTGLKCDSNKWINKNNFEEWSYLPKENFVRGCGCLLHFRSRNPEKHCVVDRW